MRAFCTVSAPLEVCASSAEQLSPGSRFLALRLLGNHQPKTLYFLVDAKSRVREVYTQTCLHFATQGMLDTELFGLAVLIDGEYMFADPESKLSKYGPKSWRSSHTHGLDANGRPLLELHFRVQFYIESPFMLKDEASRHNYYLQLKHNALHRDIPKEYSDQSMILLAGLALQADLGDAPIPAHTTVTPSSSTASSSSAASASALASTTAAATSSNISHVNSTVIEATSSSKNGSKSHDAMSTTTTTTTTLPKITKRTVGSAERALRLSTYASSSSATASSASSANSNSTSTTTTSTSPSTSTATSSTLFPIGGSLKRGLNAVAATLSPSSSTSSINRSASLSTGAAGAAGVGAQSQSAATSGQIDYFRLDEYLPSGLRTAWASSALRACHRENRGMAAADAELHYIQQACLVHESINAHTFRMRLAKGEQGPGSSWFVVYAKGIKIYGVGETSTTTQQTTFLWPNITKLSFERKKFEIRSGDSKITLYATSDEKNKMLLTLCKETHQFSMKIAARLKEVIKREEEESNCLHACYIYSRSLHLPYKSKNDQRISVISSTSSNTTSGIVSDRVHSEDELEIMINTPPAPIAAPSTESLALAHLLDRPSVSRQTSSVGQVSLKDLEDQLAALSVRQQQKQRSSSDGESASPTELSNNTSVSNNSSSTTTTTAASTSSQRAGDSSTATDSPSSQHNVGSQCSSTCSTVVVAASVADSAANPNPLASLAVVHSSTPSSAASNRRHSTSSSLELGFSHTAQNSTLSEAESACVVDVHDFIANSSRHGDGESESVSGVYTLAHGAPPTETSGVYTMHSSEMTGQSSEIAESESQASSHYGIFQPTSKAGILSDDEDDGAHLSPSLSHSHANMDSVDGGGSNNYNHHGKRIKNEEFRLRSDSNVSTSGSFRGDGSDPTDSKHTLLSAEELTDLIVGRGTYPCRKTVSNTLDSDCDYVTLPLSMAEGESYLQGHQDTAPTDDDHRHHHDVDDLMDVLLPADPPAPPQRIDSNALNRNALANLNIRLQAPPPPYNARHEKTGVCGPPVRLSHAHVGKPAAPTPPASGANPTVSSASNVPSVPATPAPPAPPSATIDVQPPPAVVAKAAAPPPPPPTAAPAILRREPPPYPASAKPRPTSLVSLGSAAASLGHPTALASQPSGSMSSLKSEEITARFITTRPQINILKAHTSLVGDGPKPSYAAPTYGSSSAASSTGSVSSHHQQHHQQLPSHHLSQHSALNSNYGGSLSHHQHQHQQPPPPPVPTVTTASMSVAHVAAAAGAGVIPSTIGIPIVPYSLHAAHKSMSSLHQHQHQHQHQHTHQQPPPPPPPYPEMKPPPRTCVLLPVIKPRQYLPPPPPSLPRQPPPPPPQLATVYTSGQLARKQLELYQQQLYSDVDYVIYPIQDPAVSQQEYLDAKQGSLLAAMAQNPPPPHPYLAYHHHHAAAAAAAAGAWDTCKGHAIYRSTPYLPLALSTHSRYASTQNLSDTYVQLPGTYSPLYSPSVASLCSSYEPPPPPPLHPATLAVAAAASTSNLFARSRSDDNILNSIDSLPKVKRLPPPPPPPYVNRRLKKPPMPAPTEKPPPIPSKPVSSSTNNISSSNISMSANGNPSFARSQFPPPKPPTLCPGRNNSHMTKTSSGAQWAGERPKPESALGRSGGSSSILAHLQASVAAANLAAMNAAAASNSAKASSTATGSGASGNTSSAAAAAAAAAAANAIDIALLREKSKNLDLPLISALCNDRSLLKQTKAFVPPKSSRNSSSTSSSTAATSASSSTITSATTSAASSATATANAGNHHSSSKSLANNHIGTSSSNAAAVMNGQQTSIGGQSVVATSTTTAQSSATTAGNNNNKYPGLTKPRKTSISHRHPNDKLPPLPMQLAEANNYVMDPAILKHHKSYNSQT